MHENCFLVPSLDVFLFSAQKVLEMTFEEERVLHEKLKEEQDGDDKMVFDLEKHDTTEIAEVMDVTESVLHNEES